MFEGMWQATAESKFIGWTSVDTRTKSAFPPLCSALIDFDLPGELGSVLQPRLVMHINQNNFMRVSDVSWSVGLIFAGVRSSSRKRSDCACALQLHNSDW
jgi:hypothetical protein